MEQQQRSHVCAGKAGVVETVPAIKGSRQLSASPDSVRGGVCRPLPPDHLPACSHSILSYLKHISRHNRHTSRPHSSTHYLNASLRPSQSPGSLAAALPHFGHGSLRRRIEGVTQNLNFHNITSLSSPSHTLWHSR